jgi:citrate synthase
MTTSQENKTKLSAPSGLPEGYKPGLEGIIAGTSTISEVSPDLDALIYRGYKAHELADQATFDEVSYLLLYGKLPNRNDLKAYQEELLKERSLPSHILTLLKQLPASPHPMVSLQLGIELIHMIDPDATNNTEAANFSKAKRLIAKTPTLIAALYRISQGKDPIAPNPSLDHASNFIYMVTGKEPEVEIGRVFGSTMVLYAEHGYNASTFSAIVTASTLSDIHSSIISAIGTLKGPLHGGANEAAIKMMLKIAEPENVEPWLKDALAKKEKVMGFGHRVYKKQDSRAPYMKILAEKMAAKVGDTKLFPLSIKLEEAVKREKNLFPNVDYHAAVAYYFMGLPIEIYTPIFAMARMPGWTAHVIEQLSSNRLIRPDCFYTGPKDLTYIPLDQR